MGLKRLSAQQTTTTSICYISLLSYVIFMLVFTTFLSPSYIVFTTTTTATSTAIHLTNTLVQQHNTHHVDDSSQPITKLHSSSSFSTSHDDKHNNNISEFLSSPTDIVTADGRSLSYTTDMFVSHNVLSLPFGGTVKNSCQEGKFYTIKSMEQLEGLKNEMHCVMSVGFPPEVLPLGAAPGKSLMVLNTDFWNKLGNKFYQGQFYTESKCNGTNYTFDFSRSIPGFSVTTALLSLGNFNEELMDGETFDGGPCLITDYSVSAGDLCGHAEGSESDWRVKRMSPYFNNIWPFKNVKYCVRIVGCDSDGAFLMLKRSFIRSDLTGKYFTLLYAALKSYDSRLSTTWKCGDSIGPTKAEEYKRMGSPTFMAHFAPLAPKMFKHSIFKNEARIGPLA
eukprot:GHVS01026125.1.p1 GENE.GHVS01026125.1~~GHVS01026125.1.p1  ORF type:complete len:393 (+),score=49.49 GHVS01026125.1:254-1432(+)